MNIILASGSPRRKELLEQIGLNFEVIPAKGEEIVTKTVPSEIVCELSRQKAEEVASIVASRGGEEQSTPKTGGSKNAAKSGEQSSPKTEGQNAAKSKEQCSLKTEGQNAAKNKEQCSLKTEGQNAAKSREQDSPKTEGQSTAKDREPQIIIGADTIVCLDGKVMGKPASRESAVRMLESLQGRKHSVYTGVSVLVRKPGQETVCHTFFSETKVEIYPMEKCEIEEYVDTGDPMDKAGAYGIQGRFAAWVKSIEGDYNNVVGLPVSALWQVLKDYR